MEIRWLGEVELTFNPSSTVPLSVCPAGKTVQSTGEDIGDIWKSGGSVKYVALSPPAEEEDMDIGEIYGGGSVYRSLVTVPLSVCPAGKTVQSTGEDIGD